MSTKVTTDKKQKHPLIVFSGGLDSTYLLYCTLLTSDVYTCYFEANQGPSKIHAEHDARESIIRILEQITGHRVIRDTIVTIPDVQTVIKDHWDKRHHQTVSKVPDKAWGQSHQWLNALLYVSDASKHSEIMMGYLSDDGLAQYYDSIIETWRLLQRTAKTTPVDLKFPLSVIPKENVFRRLPLEIQRATWTCELPVGDHINGILKIVPCENCGPCRTKAKEVFMWERMNDRDYKNALEEAWATHQKKYGNDLGEPNG